MPLPAPASVRVLAGTGAVFEASDESKELVNPTGAAIPKAEGSGFTLRMEAGAAPASNKGAIRASLRAA